jgi:hypothetical protein
MKLTINIDSTVLSKSGCIRDLYWTLLGDLDEQGQSTGGYKEKGAGPELVYGIGVHKFIDVAYKTGGNLVLARKKARELFDNIPTKDHPKKPWLRDGRHLDTVCMNVWNDFIAEDNAFQLLNLDLPCWLCKGKGEECPSCGGKKIVEQPATEITFSIRYYEDDNIIVNLCGTIDKIGKFTNGPYAFGDWKTTGTWDNRGYFQQYELSRQLRMYKLALKLMAAMHPDSVLGTIGRSNPQCFIDAIFLDKDPNKIEVIRSDIISINDSDLDEFQMSLDNVIKRLSDTVKTGYIPREGIINGHCIKWQNVSEQNFVKCTFWDVCKSTEQVAKVLLKRDFQRVKHDPLNYNEI